MTSREAGIISAFTGIHMGNFSAMHQYIEEIMERPVFTHELADKEIVKQIKEKSRADFMAICENVAD